MISKIKYEYLLGIIAVLWVLFFSFVLQLKPYFYQLGDDATYLEASKLLYFKGLLDNTRPFLIAALFGIPYLFGFNDDIVIRWGYILNFCSWFFTIILIFKIGLFYKHSYKPSACEPFSRC